jgi:hypothetical protein
MSRKDKSSDGERLRQASVEENPDDKLFLNSHAGIGKPIDFIGGLPVLASIIYNSSREAIYSMIDLALPSASPEDNSGCWYIFVSLNPRHRSYSPEGNIAPLHRKDSNYTYPMPYPNLPCESVAPV